MHYFCELYIVPHVYTVAAQVMSQPKHVFKKATLSLELIKKKKDSRKMNQLLIRGLPGGTKGDVYEVRLGGLLGMDEEEDFDLAINDDTTAVITFTESYSKSGKFMKYTHT